MPAVVCPACQEAERLSGRRRPDDTVEVTCLACGEVWDRDAARRCNRCGSTDLVYAPRPLWAKGRGDQHTPAGRIDAYSCRQCGGHDVTASNRATAVEAPPSPGARPAAPRPATVPEQAASSGGGAPPGHRLLFLQRLDGEVDRLASRARNLPEQRRADASAEELRAAARTMMALVDELQRLQGQGAAGPDGQDALEQVRRKLDEARRQGEQLAARHREQVAAVEQAAAALEVESAQAAQRRRSLADALDPDELEAYEAMRARVRDPVAVLVDIGACGGCRVVVPPAEREHARAAAATTLARCPSCGRFLVFDVV